MLAGEGDLDGAAAVARRVLDLAAREHEPVLAWVAAGRLAELDERAQGASEAGRRWRHVAVRALDRLYRDREGELRRRVGAAARRPARSSARRDRGRGRAGRAHRGGQPAPARGAARHRAGRGRPGLPRHRRLQGGQRRARARRGRRGAAPRGRGAAAGGRPGRRGHPVRRRRVRGRARRGLRRAVVRGPAAGRRRRGRLGRGRAEPGRDRFGRCGPGGTARLAGADAELLAAKRARRQRPQRQNGRLRARMAGSPG